jgi:hypothetical protein
MILRRFLLPAICVLTLAFNITPAHADTWTYTFSGTNTAPGGNGLSVAFQYSTSSAISGFTPLFASQLNSCTSCVASSVGIPAVYFQPNNVFGDQIVFDDFLNTGSAFMFPFGAFIAPGTYTSRTPFNPGTLTVQVVPEPSSIILFLSGLAGIVGVTRRRLAVG